MTDAPPYFEDVRASAARRWAQLKQDPDLAGPWHQLFKQVQSPRHVVSELLQNADDAGATEATVDIQDGEFVFAHNGEDFKEEHFASLCRFGYSNKRALHTIGFRGIGFKSTFSLGDEVCLATPTLSVAFRRERFTEPVWCDIAEEPALTTVRVAIKDEHRQRDLEKNLAEWLRSPASLLFFPHIRSLRIGDKKVCWESCGVGPIPDSEWMTLSSAPDKKHLLIRSPEEEFPADALDEIRQERMVSIDEESTFPPCRVEIVLGLEGRLFVILPTGVTTDLPFACNAPFVQDPARVKIKDPETSPTNRWLLHRIGKLAVKALLAWVSDEKQDADQRAHAYDLLPDVDRENNSLEGSCASAIEQAMDEEIGQAKFLLTEPGQLVARKECQTVPPILLDIWAHDQVAAFFTNAAKAILSRYVSSGNRQKLANWQCVDCVTKSDVIEVLETKHLPRPESWRQLMLLWTYLSDDVTSLRFYSSHTGVKIVPVQGQDVLYAAAEVVRLGEKKLLKSEEDWNFLAQHLLVLNQNWARFITEQRRKAEEHKDKAFCHEVEQTTGLLDKLGLTQTSDVSEVIQQVANKFFGQEDCDIADCIRLAQMAASLGAAVTELFEFVTQDGCRRKVNASIVVDIHNNLDMFVPEEWYREHVLHKDYLVLLSCTEDEWRQWIYAGKSGLDTFIPIQKKLLRFHSKRDVEVEVAQRQWRGNVRDKYTKEEYEITDWDFDNDLWDYWQKMAEDSPDFWCRLMARVLNQPPRFWSTSLFATVNQMAVVGRNYGKKFLAAENVPAAWLNRFRELPCLQDTRGKCRHPAEMLRRTPDTESLLDVEPFVRAEFDTEATRPLLIMFGVRDTPTGPDRLLDRLRALATVAIPPVYEVEKWYHRLDQLLNRCSPEEFAQVKDAFANEKIILSEDNSWTSTAEVFLAADEEDVPGAAVKMVPLLKDEDYTVRQRTVWALRKTLTTERLSELLETHGGFLVAQLDDPNELTCRAAVEIMGLLGESSAGLAIRGLNSKSSVGRRNAAKALLQIQARDVRALGPLLEALVDMQDDALRAAAAGALGYIGDARAVMPLIEALKDHEIHVRLSAIKSLGLLGDNRAVAELAGIVNDQKAEIRLATVKALGEFGDAAVEILSAKLKDDDPEIRDAVAESLGKIGDPRSEQALLAALEQIKGQGLKKNASRCIIVKALGQIHSGKDVIEALLRLLETTPRRNDATLNAVNRALENITGACVYSGIIYPDCGYNNLLQDWQKWWRDHEDDFTSQPKNGI